MEDREIYGSSNFTFKQFIENKLSEKGIFKKTFRLAMGWNSIAVDTNLVDVSNLRLRNIAKMAEIIEMDYEELLSMVIKFEKHQPKK